MVVGLAGQALRAAGAGVVAQAPGLSSGRVDSRPQDWREQLPQLELRAVLKKGLLALKL